MMIMKTYDMYGTTLSIYKVAEILSELLNLQFEERESSYVGVYLTTDYLAEEQFEVRTNFDPLDNEPAELNFPEWPTLLYISGTDRSKQIYETIKNTEMNFALLKSEII